STRYVFNIVMYKLVDFFIQLSLCFFLTLSSGFIHHNTGTFSFISQRIDISLIKTVFSFPFLICKFFIPHLNHLSSYFFISFIRVFFSSGLSFEILSSRVSTEFFVLETTLNLISLVRLLLKPVCSLILSLISKTIVNKSNFPCVSSQFFKYSP